MVNFLEMKKLSVLYSLLFIFSILSVQVFSQCKPKPVVKLHKEKIKPYSMDSYTENEVTFDGKNNKIEVQFSAFAGEKYKLIFCTEAMPADLKVAVYDKGMKAKTRKELYSQTMNSSALVLPAFETKRAGNYFIQLEVPAESGDSTGVVKKACVYTLIGFEEEEEAE
jgi:hypothetical protein